jgi:uncharacterized protein YutE (UPF0331/DUF86 family)/predicted nucleotidyltransferase
MAFLFGSRAKDFVHGGSDWDIAVYFQPKEGGWLEWENWDRDYPQEDAVWSDCIDLLKSDNVDLVVLNRAPATMVEAALNGVPLCLKDRDLWLKLLLVATQEAEDFRGFVDDYFEVSQRSRSLEPQDAQRLKRILSFLEEQAGLYSYFQNLSEAEYTGDIHKRNDVERWVENVANASIDVSKIVLASMKKAIPATYRETMERASQQLGLGDNVAKLLAGWSKLRNILAHEYLDIRWKRIKAFITSSQSPLDQFVDAAKRFQ